MTTLRQAAQAVVERWDAPLWKDEPATAVYIAALRKALEAPEQEPVAVITECEIMGQQTATEIEGRWKFLKVGDKLYAKPVEAPDIKALTQERDALMAAGKLAVAALNGYIDWDGGNAPDKPAFEAITALKQAGVAA